ncbi:MAG: hypothetical protein IKI37_02280, partial [Oscillospiraceae bacterium]|nr:hypothetical protein [Oscillospiraceae bacterium]
MQSVRKKFYEKAVLYNIYKRRVIMNRRFNFKKVTAGVFSLALVGSMASMFPVTAFAGDQTVNSTEDMLVWMQGFESDSGQFIYTGVSEYTVDSPANVAVAPEQTSFDLRNVNGKNYVSPVKQQAPYGTCWAFAATAAAESSIAHEVDFDFNTESDPIDLSEHHLAYFSATPLPENSPLYSSQAGEGVFVPRVEEMKQAGYDLATTNTLFYDGGNSVYATTLYSAFCGPTAEEVVPYRGDRGRIEASFVAFEFIKDPTEPVTFQNFEEFTGGFEIMNYTREEYEQALLECQGAAYFDVDVDSWYHGPGVYLYRDGGDFQLSANDDWSVSEDLRFTGFAELERSCILPSPATKDSTGAYCFNENGLNAIKNELVNGRAVVINMCADMSQPGQSVSTDGFMNFVDENGNGNVQNPEEAKYWCHYTYDKTYDPSDPESINKFVGTSHAVTIVGYDDSIPKEYFNDPNGTIGGGGAFIVKNSWGSLDTDGSFWGNDGSGYFYLSYYDQSLNGSESFDFKLLTDEAVKKDKYSASVPFIYDLLPSSMLYEAVCGTETSMANIFEAPNNTQIRSVGYTAISANEEITYDIYILNEDATSPTDGVLAGHASEVYPYSGYQRTELDTPVTVKAGQRFAVVVTAKREDGNYGIGLKVTGNENRYKTMLNQCIAAGMTDEDINKAIGGLKIGKGVVNKGESMF